MKEEMERMANELNELSREFESLYLRFEAEQISPQYYVAVDLATAEVIKAHNLEHFHPSRQIKLFTVGATGMLKVVV